MEQWSYVNSDGVGRKLKPFYGGNEFFATNPPDQTKTKDIIVREERTNRSLVGLLWAMVYQNKTFYFRYIHFCFAQFNLIIGSKRWEAISLSAQYISLYRFPISELVPLLNVLWTETPFSMGILLFKSRVLDRMNLLFQKNYDCCQLKENKLVIGKGP